MKNLADFNRDFRFGQQKHIWAAVKQTRRRSSDVTTQGLKNRKENIYETQL